MGTKVKKNPAPELGSKATFRRKFKKRKQTKVDSRARKDVDAVTGAAKKAPVLKPKKSTLEALKRRRKK